MNEVKIETTNNNICKQKLSENIIWLLMYVISLIHGLMCIANGILSSCVTEIKTEFDLNDQRYGMLGTINGFGSLIGSIAFIFVIEKIDHKYLICSMLITNSLCHFSFYFKFSYYQLLMSRFISGFASVFGYIYFPMWVNRFAMMKWVNFMQTTVQLSNTIGHIFGYFLFLILGSKNWRYGFLTEIFMISCLVFIMFLIPNKYYDKNYDNKEYSEINTYEQNEQEKENMIKDIIYNVPYILITLYRGNRLFIFAAVDFWFSNYLQKAFSETNPNSIFYSYLISIVLANVIGNILGGVIINRIGGTHSKYSFRTMAILQFLCVFFGIFTPFTKSVLFFTVLMSLYMLFNSASGIITISASFAVIPKALTGTATGIYSLVVNLIAFLPGPYAYALIKKIVGEERYIMVILMIYGLIGGMELVLADVYMRVNIIKIYKQEFKSEEIRK